MAGPRIALVAGELSGDLLGAGLIAALRRRWPDARFEGIGGPGMVGAGLEGLYPLEKLSVMGLVEVLKHLPELMRIRRGLLARWRTDPPALFVGIDAPDFNLPLARKLRAAGVRAAHYVSPSVWAWRQGRVKGIARSVDLMLTLFPFEAAFYQAHAVPVACVGHPLADAIPLETDRQAARRALGLPEGGHVLAVLPGSRGGEVARHGALFVAAAQRFAARHPGLRILVPCATARLRAQLEAVVAGLGDAGPVRLLDGQAREALGACDLALVASGTATLEAMLVGRPQVMAYRVAPLTYAIAKRLMKIARFSLPNLLADRDLIPELIQDAATPEALAVALEAWLAEPARAEATLAEFARLHRELKRDASETAAAALVGLLERQR